MSDLVKVPFKRGTVADTAVLLLAAAEELKLPGSVIKTTAGAFLVPAEIEKRAFRKESDTPAPVKKAAAKKSTTPEKAQE